MVVDKALNLDILTEIRENHSPKFRIVCAAEIYDELFRQVRIWARMGYSAEDIQNELDTSFKAVSDIIEVKRLAISSSNSKGHLKYKS